MLLVAQLHIPELSTLLGLPKQFCCSQTSTLRQCHLKGSLSFQMTGGSTISSTVVCPRRNLVSTMTSRTLRASRDARLVHLFSTFLSELKLLVHASGTLRASCGLRGIFAVAEDVASHRVNLSIITTLVNPALPSRYAGFSLSCMPGIHPSLLGYTAERCEA